MLESFPTNYLSRYFPAWMSNFSATFVHVNIDSMPFSYNVHVTDNYMNSNCATAEVVADSISIMNVLVISLARARQARVLCREVRTQNSFSEQESLRVRCAS